MAHRTRIGAAVAAMAAAATTLAVGAGPAGAGPAEAPAATATGWVVDNPRADGVAETNEGSVTIVNVAGGATVSCPTTSGWVHADSATLRPQDTFGETGFTNYGGGGCTGAGGATAEVISSSGMALWPEAYDAAADRVSGAALPWLWALAIEAPGCWVEMYAEDPNSEAPLTYDNRTGTLDIGPVEAVVAVADGAGCAGLARVGDAMTFEATLVATPAFTVRPA